MTTAQLLFSVALAVISLIIVSFAVYVVSSSTWGNRWYRHPRGARRDQSTEEK